jgi:hypothetical protein
MSDSKLVSVTSRTFWLAMSLALLTTKNRRPSQGGGESRHPKMPMIEWMSRGARWFRRLWSSGLDANFFNPCALRIGRPRAAGSPS